MPKKQEQPKKELSPWWLLSPFLLGIADVWVWAYFYDKYKDTWMTTPIVITGAVILAAAFVLFLALAHLIPDAE